MRAASILRKSKVQTPNFKIGDAKNLARFLNTPEDIALMLKLTQFPDMLEAAAEDLNVGRLARYAMELANEFHLFYEKERIVGEEQYVASARRELVSATAIVLKNLLDILGISAPKKM